MEIHRVSAASYAGDIHASFYGFDMGGWVGGAVKGILAELLFGNMGVGIPSYVRNDNSDAAYQVDPANTVTNEKRLNVFLEGNMG